MGISISRVSECRHIWMSGICVKCGLPNAPPKENGQKTSTIIIDLEEYKNEQQDI